MLAWLITHYLTFLAFYFLKISNMMVLYISMYICVCIYSHCEMIQFSSVGQSFLTLCDPHGMLHARPPCPSPTPGVYSNSCPSSQWCHPTISSSVIPFSSHLQSLPASGSFPMSWFMAYPILFFMASDFTSITSHIHNWALVFALALSLHSFWSYYFSSLLQ